MVSGRFCECGSALILKENPDCLSFNQKALTDIDMEINDNELKSFSQNHLCEECIRKNLKKLKEFLNEINTGDVLGSNQKKLKVSDDPLFEKFALEMSKRIPQNKREKLNVRLAGEDGDLFWSENQTMQAWLEYLKRNNALAFLRQALVNVVKFDYDFIIPLIEFQRYAAAKSGKKLPSFWRRIEKDDKGNDLELYLYVFAHFFPKNTRDNFNKIASEIDHSLIWEENYLSYDWLSFLFQTKKINHLKLLIDNLDKFEEIAVKEEQQ